MRSLRILSAASFLVLASGMALAAETATIAPVPAMEVAASADTAVVSDVLTVDAVADACELNYTPADPEEDELGVSAKPCKPCQDRPFCKCTYNGLPRVSCNPCCYGHLGIPQTCFD